MAIREIQFPIMDLIPVKTALISVFDKGGLFRNDGVEGLVDGLIAINPDILILSTGGTYSKIEQFLGADAAKNLHSVDDYTGVPEMEGGLVKTLVPKIHAGILGERENPAHQSYLARDMGAGKYVDLLVSNFYPFTKVTAEPGCTIEHARGNIDIGGPSMVRGAAKNFHGCAVLMDPKDYTSFLASLRANDGCTALDQRFELSKKVWRMTRDYDAAVSAFLENHGSVAMLNEYKGKIIRGGRE